MCTQTISYLELGNLMLVFTGEMLLCILTRLFSILLIFYFYFFSKNEFEHAS
jgi:hypothetical protein